MGSQTFSLIEIAGLLNVSRGTVDRWLKQGCPFIERADRNRGREWQLSLPDVVEWRERRAVEQAIGDTSKLDIEEARRRKVAAGAAFAELSLAKERGQVVSVEVAMQVIGDQLSVCRSRLLSMPNKIGPLVAPVTDVNECVERLRLAVVEALDELTGFDIAGGLGPAAGAHGLGDEGDDGGAVSPAAHPKRQPVGRSRKASQS